MTVRDLTRRVRQQLRAVTPAEAVRWLSPAVVLASGLVLGVAGIQRAFQVSSPDFERILSWLLLAVILALVLGIAWAIFLETQHARIRSIEDVAEALNLPVLATIPVTQILVRHPRR